MKITHLIPALTKGGAEKVLVDLANLAVAGGHEVTVIAAFPVDPALLQDQVDPRVAIQFIGSAGRGKRAAYFKMLPWLARNWHWLRQQDVVHCHLTYGALLGSLITIWRRFSGSAKPRVVETFHGVGTWTKWWQRWLARVQAKRRDGYALMAEDDYWREFAVNNSALPLAIIPNGIALEHPPFTEEDSRAYRLQAGIPDGARIIGTIGRLRAERNPLATVAAFAESAKFLGPDVHFLIAGDGPMADVLHAEGDRLGLGERLHLPGLAAKPWVAASVIDVYISLNVGPITGIAGLEAAAAEIPLIALQATADHRLGDEDWIWSDPDPVKVGAEAARLLLAPDERKELALRQSAHVRVHHSAEAMLDAYFALYAKAGVKD